jgi:hypothetical protein
VWTSLPVHVPFKAFIPTSSFLLCIMISMQAFSHKIIISVIHFSLLLLLVFDSCLCISFSSFVVIIVGEPEAFELCC